MSAIVYAVDYRFIDRDSGQAGQGNALVRFHGEDDFDPEDHEHRDTLEVLLADAIAQQFPHHKQGRLVILLTSCAPASGEA